MSQRLLNDEIVAQVSKAFEQLKEPVQILFFGGQQNCDYCGETLLLVQEVAGLSDKLNLAIYDVDADAEIAQKYKVDKTPTLIIAGRQGDQIEDYGIRLAGLPSGHEFSSLIHDLIMVSNRDSGLSQSARQYLQGLDKPVSLQVFVTPSCPYCPQAVLLAHSLAMESAFVTAEMVEAMEFPDLADRFQVSGVPHTSINAGAGAVIGAVPEEHFISELQRALSAA